MSGSFDQTINPPLPPLRIEGGRSNGKPRSSVALLILALVLGGTFEVFGPDWLKRAFVTVQFGSVRGISAVFAALVASVLLHESGHLVAALLMNFELLGISVGPLRLSMTHGKWSHRMTRNGLLRASVSAVPRGDNEWHKRMLVVIAGGPIATLLTILVTPLFFLRATPHSWSAGFYAALIQLNLFIFVLGLIPNDPRSRVRNDAALFLSVFRGKIECGQILLYHLGSQLQVAGVRPRDYPERLIHKLAFLRGRADTMLWCAQTIAAWALDRHDIATAEAWTQRSVVLSGDCSADARNSALAVSACFDVLFRNDLLAARSKFAVINFDRITPPYLRHRIKASHWLSVRNIPETLAEISHSLHALPNEVPYCDFERWMLGELHQRAMNPRGASPVTSDAAQPTGARH